DPLSFEVFAYALAFFGYDDKRYDLEPVVVHTSPDTLHEDDRDVLLPLGNRTGSVLKLQFFFASKWILISEASFDSAPLMPDWPNDDPGSSSPTFPPVAIPPRLGSPGTSMDKQAYIGVAVGVLAALILVLAAGSVAITLQYRLAQSKGKGRKHSGRDRRRSHLITLPDTPPSDGAGSRNHFDQKVTSMPPRRSVPYDVEDGGFSTDSAVGGQTRHPSRYRKSPIPRVALLDSPDSEVVDSPPTVRATSLGKKEKRHSAKKYAVPVNNFGGSPTARVLLLSDYQEPFSPLEGANSNGFLSSLHRRPTRRMETEVLLGNGDRESSGSPLYEEPGTERTPKVREGAAGRTGTFLIRNRYEPSREKPRQERSWAGYTEEQLRFAGSLTRRLMDRVRLERTLATPPPFRPSAPCTSSSPPHARKSYSRMPPGSSQTTRSADCLLDSPRSSPSLHGDDRRPRSPVASMSSPPALRKPKPVLAGGSTANQPRASNEPTAAVGFPLIPSEGGRGSLESFRKSLREFQQQRLVLLESRLSQRTPSYDRVSSSDNLQDSMSRLESLMKDFKNSSWGLPSSPCATPPPSVSSVGENAAPRIRVKSPDDPPPQTDVQPPSPLVEGPRTRVLEISHSNVQLKQMIGEGDFGNVHLGRVTGVSSEVVPENQTILVKTLKEGLSLGDRQAFRQELSVLASLIHPNLVRVLAAVTKKEPFYVILEYLPLGDLCQALSHGGKISLARDPEDGSPVNHSATE
ncbi:unnamed protein product, partial [Cyprideis torosa]